MRTYSLNTMVTPGADYSSTIALWAAARAPIMRARSPGEALIPELQTGTAVRKVAAGTRRKARYSRSMGCLNTSALSARGPHEQPL